MLRAPHTESESAPPPPTGDGPHAGPRTLAARRRQLSNGHGKARVDFEALKQWAGTGKVKRRATTSPHRRYRLGRWQTKSTSSWNPPSGQPAAGSRLQVGGGEMGRSAVSVDISHKPSESPRSSVIGLAAGSGCESEGESGDERNGPLAQMLLRENDEIWNNPAFRFTFYSPATGTVRSTDVQTLRTDEAEGLDALIRQAMGSAPEHDSSSSSSSNSTSSGQRVPVAVQAPQLSVTSADSVPDIVAAARAPDNEFLHPNYARGQTTRGGSRGKAERRRAADSGGQGLDTQQARLFWLDITDPTDSEVMALSRIFDLHSLTTEELLLMRDEGLSQDTYKSFRHYDVICYRTSAAPVVGATVAKRRSSVRDIAPRAHTPWGAAEETPADAGDLTPASLAGTSEKAQWNSRTITHGFQTRLGALFGRPRVARRAVPAIGADSPQECREAVGDEALDEPVAFYVIVLANGVITLHCTNVPHVRNTVARLLLDEELIRVTPDYITYLLLDDITDTLVPTTRLLELEVDAIDELVLILTRAEHDDVLKRIGIERRHALWMVRLLHGKAEVLRSFERRIHAKLAASSELSPYRLPPTDDDEETSEEDDYNVSESQLLTSDEEEGDLYTWSRSRPARGPAPVDAAEARMMLFLPDVTKYLADVHDHLIALTASVHHCERILARAHGNYLARINLELTHASNTTNQLATQMTVLAGIFLPLNLVAGIFGMNVKVPGRDRDDLRDFWVLIGSMAFFVITALSVCRWRGIV
ncbi:CorA metal ion transporter [Coemansia thaxteri]|nr:CorA metal ion transporter [Coemansia thaxteri]